MSIVYPYHAIYIVHAWACALCCVRIESELPTLAAVCRHDERPRNGGIGRVSGFVGQLFVSAFTCPPAYFPLETRQSRPNQM